MTNSVDGRWMGARLLAVLAHPDDETFFIGGTMALYARRGAGVSLLCATRGELGEAPLDLRGCASVAVMRETELRRATSILGLEAVHFLGYQDSGRSGSPASHHPQALAAAPLDQVARQVATYIRALRPQVVITFGPGGGYGHPDHIAIHRATVDALAIAGDPGQRIGHLPVFSPQKLYYATVSRRMLRLAIFLTRCLGKDARRVGRNKNIDLVSLLGSDAPIHASVSTREVVRLKAQAAAYYVSQRDGLGYRMQWLQRWLDTSETFVRAIPSTPPDHLERDLFEGVELGI